jgi:two-component system, response regulator PdtaR
MASSADHGLVEGCKRAAMAERPDVALMDLRLAEGSSGIDAASWLHNEMGVRCIFISGNLDDATRESLSRLRPVAFIHKPILTHQLERALVDCSQRACSASGK